MRFGYVPSLVGGEVLKFSQKSLENANFLDYVIKTRVTFEKLSKAREINR